MSFILGFVLGGMSGVAAEYYQSTYTTPRHYNNNIINNIKDLKDDLVDLKDQSKEAIQTVNDIKNDVTNYTEDIKPDVADLQDSVSELKGNLEKLQNLNE